MKRFLSVLLCAVLLVGLTACGGQGTTQKEEPDMGISKEQSYRVLFIGNSYTYYNDMWDLFAQAGESLGYTITADHVTQGGYYLDQYLNTKDPFGLQVLQHLSKNRYDAVFLQEQSTCPFQNYDRFADAVTGLDAMVKENGAKTILYQTWGRQVGSPALVSLKTTNQKMTEDLAKAYQKAAQAIGAAVSPVGNAFYDLHNNQAVEINLYDPDTTHPSLAGSYLSALCHLATFTGADVRKVTFDSELDAQTATTLKEAAYKAVFGE